MPEQPTATKKPTASDLLIACFYERMKERGLIPMREQGHYRAPPTAKYPLRPRWQAFYLMVVLLLTATWRAFWRHPNYRRRILVAGVGITMALPLAIWEEYKERNNGTQ